MVDKKVMQEKDLIELGFERTDVSREESGGEYPFYFYTWNPNDSPRSFCLITTLNQVDLLFVK